MATISVFQKDAFDATASQSFNFAYAGAQCTRSKLDIYSNEENELVYSHTQDSIALNQEVPAGTLTNGTAYYYTFTAYYPGDIYRLIINAYGMSGGSYKTIISGVTYSFTLDDTIPYGYELCYNASTGELSAVHTVSGSSSLIDITAGSAGSNDVSFDRQYTVVTSQQSPVFYCYSDPVFCFSNITDGMTIGNAYYSPEIEYSQAEGEELNSWQIIVYTYSGTEFYNSGTRYDVDNMSITLNGMQDGAQYYFRAIGETVDRTKLDTRTGEIDLLVSVVYSSPVMHGVIEAENKQLFGSVHVSSHIAAIDGHSYCGNGDLRFVNGTAADLRWSYRDDYGDVHDCVEYEGFEVGDNFTLSVLARDICPNAYVIEMGVEQPYFDLFYNVYWRLCDINGSKVAFAELQVSSYNFMDSRENIILVSICSNMIDKPTAEDTIHIWLRRANGNFSLIIENEGVIS